MRISDWSSDVCSSDLIEPVLLLCPVRHHRDWQSLLARFPLTRHFFDGSRPAFVAGNSALADAGQPHAPTRPYGFQALSGAWPRRCAHDPYPAAYAFQRIESRSEEHTSELQSLMRNS